MNKLLVLIGVALIVSGLVLQVSGASPFSAITTNGLTVNSVNPASTSQSTPTSWNQNQAQLLAAFMSSTNGLIGQYSLRVICMQSCGSPGAGQALFTTVTPSVFTGLWFNFTWPVSNLNAPASVQFGEGQYAPNAVFDVQWSGVGLGGANVATVHTYGQIAQITVTVVDFSMVANPSALSIITGATTATSGLSITPLNGFSAPIALTISCSAGLNNCGVSPATLTGTYSGGSLTVGSSSTIGTMTATVTATSGSLVHTVVVTVTATTTIVTGQDFTLSTTTPSITINAGSSAGIPITVTSLNGFAGTVSLTATPSSGLSASVAPVSVTLTGGSTAPVTLTVSAASAGTYTVVLTGTSGSLSHSLSIVSYFPSFGSGSTSFLPIILMLAGGILAAYGYIRRP